MQNLPMFKTLAANSTFKAQFRSVPVRNAIHLLVVEMRINKCIRERCGPDWGSVRQGQGCCPPATQSSHIPTAAATDVQVLCGKLCGNLKRYLALLHGPVVPPDETPGKDRHSFPLITLTWPPEKGSCEPAIKPGLSTVDLLLQGLPAKDVDVKTRAIFLAEGRRKLPPHWIKFVINQLAQEVQCLKKENQVMSIPCEFQHRQMVHSFGFRAATRKEPWRRGVRG